MKLFMEQGSHGSAGVAFYSLPFNRLLTLINADLSWVNVFNISVTLSFSQAYLILTVSWSCYLFDS